MVLQEQDSFRGAGVTFDPAALLQQRTHRMQAGAGVKRRADELDSRRPRALDHRDGFASQPGLSDSGATAKRDARRSEWARHRLPPRGAQLGHLGVAAALSR